MLTAAGLGKITVFIICNIKLHYTYYILRHHPAVIQWEQLLIFHWVQAGRSRAL